MSYGYRIASRNVSKLKVLTPHCVLASPGMQADAVALRKQLDVRLVQYEHTHQKQMTTNAVAQLLSQTLYRRRFFPYYTFNLCGGVDENGKGMLFNYDAIGSMELYPYSCKGSGEALITPPLDNQVGFRTHPQDKKDLSIDEAVALVKDAFTVAGERDIYTGDQVEINIITKQGIKVEYFQLKKD